MQRASHPALRAVLALPAAALLCASCTAPPPAADMVVRNARVVTGAGTVIEGATILMEEGRITRVARGPLDVEGRDEVDAGGATVVPGLIDAHTHLLYRPEIDGREAWLRFARDDLPAVLEELLRRGVTTVVSNGDYWPEIREVREKIRAGELLGPRILAVGPVLTAPGGHPAATVCGENAWCRERMVRELSTGQEARETVRRLAAEGVDAIKIAREDAGTGVVLPSAVVRAAVEEAHRLGLPVLAHGPADAAGAAELVEAGIDLLVHPPALCHRGLDRLVAALSRRSVPLVTTLGIVAPVTGPEGRRLTIQGSDYPPEWEALSRQVTGCLTALRRAGIPLILGTDAPALPGGRGVLREMGLLHASGMSPRQVLDAATGSPGRSVPMLGQAGILEAGRHADLLILERDPLEDLGAFATLKVVILGGRVVLDRRPR